MSDQEQGYKPTREGALAAVRRMNGWLADQIEAGNGRCTCGACSLCSLRFLLCDAPAAEVEALKKAPDFQRGEQIIRTHADVIKRLQAEVERLKETNSRLNRRCQAAEKGVRENVEACRKAGVSLGRALANAGYHMMEEEIASLRDLVREAGELLIEYRDSCSCGQELPCEPCDKADAWRKKAKV